MVNASNQIASRLTFSPLGGKIGAEVTSIRMADFDDQTFDELRMATIRHRVVAIRDQFLTPADVANFASRLGPFMATRGLTPNPDWPDLHFVTNPGKAFAITENWHSDASTSKRPPSFTVLAAETLPPAGGDTMFVNLVDAYEDLSERYRLLLRGMRLYHVNRIHSTESLIEMWHPLVRTIPETGERALYGLFRVGERLEGMTIEESRPILDFLHQHALKPERIYRHRWLPGDVVMWDNRSTMHFAIHDYGDAERTLVRAMIEGEEPYEAPYT